MNRFPTRIRRLTALIAAVLVLSLLTGCDFAVLPKELDKNTLCELAISIVNDINAGEYEKAVSRTPLPSPLSASAIETECAKRLEDLGVFDTYRLVQAIGNTVDGSPCAAVVLNCSYERGPAVYSLLFDTSYRLLELHLQ